MAGLFPLNINLTMVALRGHCIEVFMLVESLKAHRYDGKRKKIGAEYDIKKKKHFNLFKALGWVKEKDGPVKQAVKKVVSKVKPKVEVVETAELTSESVSEEITKTPSEETTAPKRRGRPPKSSYMTQDMKAE